MNIPSGTIIVDDTDMEITLGSADVIVVSNDNFTLQSNGTIVQYISEINGSTEVKEQNNSTEIHNLSSKICTPCATSFSQGYLSITNQGMYVYDTSDNLISTIKEEVTSGNINIQLHVLYCTCNNNTTFIDCSLHSYTLANI